MKNYTEISSIDTVKRLDSFYNDLSPKENIISYIIISNKQTSNLINKDFREKIALKHNIIENKSITGELIAFCEDLNLFARQYKD